MWTKDLDPYITILEPSSSHILALILEKPGLQTSVHITVYLPTAGKEAEFVRELSVLQDTIDNVGDNYPDALIFVRGDANASVVCRKGNKRDLLFLHFMEENELHGVPINHTTYHHFTNNGLSDSTIDILLFSPLTSGGTKANTVEVLDKLLCGKSHHCIDSSHDALVSSVLIPQRSVTDITKNNIVAPKIKHTKHKILWTDEGILQYQKLVSQSLLTLQSDYCEVNEPEVASILFKITNHILTEAAKRTNKSIDIGFQPKRNEPRIPSEIKAAQKIKKTALKNLRQHDLNDATTVTDKEEALEVFKAAKAMLQNVTRKHKIAKEIERDNHLLDILSKKPSNIFKSFKNAKTAESRKLKSLTVGTKTYSEENVADGFFDSISQLKTCPEISSSSFHRFAEDHRHIVEKSKSSKKIPRISESEAEKLLRRMRSGVSDFFSITSAHYINGGSTTIRHFQFLINTVIDNIELSSVDELNKVHAIILHKGHKKDRTLASSYRIISSCPFIAKATDIYLGSLSKEDWSKCQAPTEFQGSGMSHELASLCLTSAILDSARLSEPLFVLLLDAKSAFDLVIREILVRRLFLDSSSQDQRIRYWDLRLSNRSTFCQWEDLTMGPIKDQLGV